MSDTSSTSGGLGFVGALTITFVALKLTGYVDWSWFWVLSPIWVAATVSVLGLFLIVIFITIFR